MVVALGLVDDASSEMLALTMGASKYSRSKVTSTYRVPEATKAKPAASVLK